MLRAGACKLSPSAFSHIFLFRSPSGMSGFRLLKHNVCSYNVMRMRVAEDNDVPASDVLRVNDGREASRSMPLPLPSFSRTIWTLWRARRRIDKHETTAITSRYYSRTPIRPTYFLCCLSSLKHSGRCLSTCRLQRPGQADSLQN